MAPIQKSSFILLSLLSIGTLARHRQFDDDNEELREQNEAAFAKSQGGAAFGKSDGEFELRTKKIDPKALHYLGDSFEKLSDGGKLNHLIELVPFLYGKLDEVEAKHEKCQRLYQVEAKETRSNTFVQELQAQIMELKQAHFDKERAWSNAFRESTATIDELKGQLVGCEKRLSNEKGKVLRITNRVGGISGSDSTGGSSQVESGGGGGVAVWPPPSSSQSTTSSGVASGRETLRGSSGSESTGEKRSAFKWHIEKIEP